MRGCMVTISVDAEVKLRDLDGPPEPDDINRALAGGSLQLVPYFTSFQGMPCVAFCDEEGKNKGLPINQLATAMWESLVALNGRDYIAGPMVIVAGDRELINSL